MPIKNTLIGNEYIEDSDHYHYTNTGVHHPQLVNIYGAAIGIGTTIGPFVEIQNDVTIGKNCKIQSHCFICEGVVIRDEVFIGHGVLFINDRNPDVSGDNWILEKTLVEDEVSIGTGAVIMCGVTLHKGCKVGAGAVVTKDVEAGETVVGVPARSHAPKLRDSVRIGIAMEPEMLDVLGKDKVTEMAFEKMGRTLATHALARPKATAIKIEPQITQDPATMKIQYKWYVTFLYEEN